MLKNLWRCAQALVLASAVERSVWRPAALALASLAAAPAAQAALPLQACFVYVSPIGQAGWTFQHEQGRLAMVQALGAQVRTRVVEAVAEGADSERVMRDLARDGCGLIVASSFGYGQPALRVAADFPNVRFVHAGGYQSAPNLATYNGRFYEGRWLAGWLAGKTSARGLAGYVAGFPVPEVVQGINAFALGMRAANPKAQVQVLWLNTWFDPAREREAALALVAQGADVLTNHSGSAAVPQVAQEKGVALLAYTSDMAAFAPQAQLATVSHHWGGYYTALARAVIDGRWSNQPVWAGLGDGLVQLSALNPTLPATLKATLAAHRDGIASGRQAPFAAPLVDNGGTVRLASGRLTDEQIAGMDWFVQGVIGSVPAPR